MQESGVIPCADVLKSLSSYSGKDTSSKVFITYSYILMTNHIHILYLQNLRCLISQGSIFILPRQQKYCINI